MANLSRSSQNFVLRGLWILIAVLSFVNIAASTGASKDVPVVVKTNASFPAPPSFSVELLESYLLQSQNNVNVIKFVDFLIDENLLGTNDREFSKTRFDTLVGDALYRFVGVSKESGALRADQFLSRSIIEMVEMTLALRAATPRVEALRQVYLNVVSKIRDEFDSASGWSYVTDKSTVKSILTEGFDSWATVAGVLVGDDELSIKSTLSSITDLSVDSYFQVASGQNSDRTKRSQYIGVDFISSNVLPKETVAGLELTEECQKRNRLPSVLPPVIIYADLESPKFPEFYRSIRAKANDLCLPLVLRYSFSAKNTDTVDEVFVTGYGVEMALKKTEYSVSDDRELERGKKRDDSAGNNETVKNSEASFEKEMDELASELFGDGPAEIVKLNYAVLSTISLRAAQFLTDIGLNEDGTFDSDTALKALKIVSQDYPKVAHLVSKTEYKYSKSTLDAFANFARAIPNNDAIFFVNDIEMEPNQFKNLHYLHDLMALDLATITRLISQGATKDQARSIISDSTYHIQESRSTKETTKRPNGFPYQELYDINGPFISWMNDIEKDPMYSVLPQSILASRNPYNLQPVRRNLISIVTVLDLGNTEQITRITSIMDTVKTGVIFRIGVIPSIHQDVTILDTKDLTLGTKLAVLLVDISRQPIDSKSAFEFIEEIVNSVREEGSVNADRIFKAYKANVKVPSGRNIDKAVGAILSKKSKDFKRLQEFTDKFACLEGADTPTVYANGCPVDVSANWMEPVISLYQKTLRYLQMQIMQRVISESTDIYTHFVSSVYAKDARNPYVAVDSAQQSIIDWSSEQNNELLQNLKWYTNSPESEHNSSLVIVADFKTPKVHNVLYETLKYAKRKSNVRVAFVQVNNDGSTGVANAALDTETYGSVVELMDLIDEDIDSLHSYGSIVPYGVISDLVTQNKETPGFGFIVNSRIVGYITDLRFHGEIINEIVDEDQELRVEPVTKYWKPDNGAETGHVLAQLQYDNLLLSTLSFVNERSFEFVHGEQTNKINAARRNPYFCSTITTALDEAGVLKLIYGNKDDSIFTISAIIDPVSEDAQKTVDVLIGLSKLQSLNLNIYILPKLKSMRGDADITPIKRFYRSTQRTKLVFDEGDGRLVQPSVKLTGLPADSLLTLGLDIPDSWLVLPVESVYDLDNILLKSVTPGNSGEPTVVDAKFELKNILVEGHTSLHKVKGVPQGLEWTLGAPSADQRKLDGTITMNNFGYIQFKSQPGVQELQIRSGRSKEIYEIDNVKGAYYPAVKKVNMETKELFFVNESSDDSSLIFLDSFGGKTIFPAVSKRPGMEKESIIDTDLSNPSPIKSFFNNMFSKGDDSSQDDVINVFSVASGHLYERFLGIMMRSVTHQSKSKVKFWLIQNFLSPKFLEFLPFLAQELGCEYELITYKWPHWLNPQTEKQRIIWAYKILFLDVMFPLDLDKVIFVDADQVVRTDLKELVDIDLQGAVYGYTPFCDDRPETEEFRFWKKGYWKQQLGDRPYHISALYVIDLKRFRQYAAGDKLRQSYHMLSQDPNSLANLDQDLPNNMMHEIPIFSLPQEWLWCETWCSDQSLAKAKTIDLCNNPLTKEPKLDRARRILPEWDTLDKEVETIHDKFKSQKGSIGTSKHAESQKEASPARDDL